MKPLLLGIIFTAPSAFLWWWGDGVPLEPRNWETLICALGVYLSFIWGVSGGWD